MTGRLENLNSVEAIFDSQPSMDFLLKSFPTNLAMDVSGLLKKVNLKGEHRISNSFNVSLDGERLEIPYRIYFNEPKETGLNSTELLILNCLFTRHHNGFVRQHHLKTILQAEKYWVAPFIMSNLGEYVIEILFTIRDNLDERRIQNLGLFRNENPRFFETTKQRIISYWDCYYRTQYPRFCDYVGFEIINAIEEQIPVDSLLD